MATTAIDQKGFTAFGDRVIGVLKKLVASNVSRDERLDSLERRCAELQSALDIEKARPRGLLYKGTWQRASSYNRDEGVTYDGSTWVCLGDEVRTQPTVDPKNWQLSAKCGRDGRDAR